MRHWWVQGQIARLQRKARLADEDWYTHREHCRACILDHDCELIAILGLRRVYWANRLVQYKYKYGLG